MLKSTGNSDGPEAKKSKVDPNETIMVKKVRGYYPSCFMKTLMLELIK